MRFLWSNGFGADPLETVEDFLDSTYTDYNIFSFRGGRLVRGRLRVMTDDCLAGLRSRLRALGWLHSFEKIDGVGYLTCTVLDTPLPQRRMLHLGLFGITILTTMIAGSDFGFGLFYKAIMATAYCLFQAGSGLFATPVLPEQTPLFWLGQAGRSMWTIIEVMARGIPFSFAILTILGCHEMGHYLVARRHGMNVTLPFFIPVPLGIGTLGAVIRIKGPLVHRRAVLDVGAAGPLAGFVLSVFFLVLGLGMSSVAPFDPRNMIPLGHSLLTGGLARLICGPLAPGMGLVWHPFALAGWIGLLVTGINLMPMGQLDGGHIAYAFFGKFQRSLAFAALGLLSTLGVVGMLSILDLAFVRSGSGYLPWLLCATFMRLLMKPAHPPALDESVKLNPGRKLIAVLCFVLLVVLFVPSPIPL